MRRIINLKTDKPIDSIGSKVRPPVSMQKTERVLYNESNREFIINNYPDKLYFSISEVAGILNVSIEFIRLRTVNGQINTTKMGRRKLVNREELIRIISEGIN